MKRIILILLTLLTTNVWASNVKVDFFKMHYYFNEDATYTLTVTERLKVLSDYGAKEAQKRPISYFPDTEQFTLLRAFVIKANGKKVAVPKEQVFTRTASDDSNAPGFNNRMTTTVVYPNLSRNDSTYVSYQVVRKKPQQIGFSTLISPSYEVAQRKQVMVLNMPKEMPLRWIKHGKFHVSDKIHNTRRIIIASLLDQPEVFSENNMADLGDNMPYFLASNNKSWDEIGQRFWSLCKDKIEITPDIKKLATRLTAKKKGIQRARAIHNWVAKNIHYIAVYLDEGAGVEPHPASQVLANGYGDCKDHTVLTIALLKAAGIKAYPVLVNAGPNYFKYPLPNANQFNHAMVYIPEYKIFSNPTSEFESFGDLDGYSSDKFVVIAAPNPILSHTPAGSPKNSHYTSHKKISINEHGDITGEALIKMDGRANHNARHLFNGAILKILAMRVLEESEGGLGKLNTSDPTDLNSNMQVHANWKSPEVLDIDNETFFEVPMGMEFKSPRRMSRLIQVETRHFPTMIGAGMVDWNIEINLPKDFSLAHMPKNTHFINQTGRYDSEYFERNGKLFVRRKFSINKDVYSPKEYPFLKELLYQPVKDARSVISMRRNLH